MVKLEDVVRIRAGLHHGSDLWAAEGGAVGGVYALGNLLRRVIVKKDGEDVGGIVLETLVADPLQVNLGCTEGIGDKQPSVWGKALKYRLLCPAGHVCAAGAVVDGSHG